MSHLDLSSLREQYKVRKYFYRVTQFVTTFGEDPEKNDSFRHSDDFKDKNLLEAREMAVSFYNEKLKGMENGKYFLPFASPDEFIPGENSAFSITLALVLLYVNGEEEEYYLCDYEGQEAQADNLRMEESVLNEQGYSL